MATALQPLGMDGLEPGKEEQVPCVTISPHRASEHLQEGFSGGRPRAAGKAPVKPGASSNRGREAVHGLFRFAVALALLISVPWGTGELSFGAVSRIEVSGRLVAKTDHTTLGNMATALQPLGMDGLLRSAGFGV